MALSSGAVKITEQFNFPLNSLHLIKVPWKMDQTSKEIEISFYQLSRRGRQSSVKERGFQRSRRLVRRFPKVQQTHHKPSFWKFKLPSRRTFQDTKNDLRS